MDDGSQWAAPQPEGHAHPEQPGPGGHGQQPDDQTSYDQASYDQTPYGQTSYDQASYDQTPYGQAPYGQASYDQAPYGQAPYGVAPHGQAPYGQQPYGQAPYGQQPYAQAPYAQAPYGQAPYGQAPYGQQPYGQAPYGYGPPSYPPPGWGAPQYGPPGFGGWGPEPRRPTVATSAGVLGIVTGALTAIGSLIALIAAAGGADAATTVLVLGLPCAVGLLVGGLRLLQGHRAGLLFGSALAALGVLALALVAGLLLLDGDDVVGLAAFLLFAAVLPIITAVFARLPEVTRWVEG
ncbi:hypothetical protein [Blastococcus xanthinilyticus]|uniref:Uncharacterized protein n=1 Tax=Blastococcus xanthinilyticus TaxID=1564164 RepID=A0A5S5CL69_9ACTN|nr:hypothetical protein [Blastococcus xanthinilyticus]TYP81333.1 hypothetical protein BD833_12330 [Blastococcus xanthinilyticus]